MHAGATRLGTVKMFNLIWLPELQSVITTIMTPTIRLELAYYIATTILSTRGVEQDHVQTQIADSMEYTKSNSSTPLAENITLHSFEF